MISAMKLHRVKREVSQTDLFLRTGIPQWRISLIERGILPRSEEARKIAKELGADIKKLFPEIRGGKLIQITEREIEAFGGKS